MNPNISLIIPYYNHPGFLKFQLEMWNSYSEKVKENVEIILVDDCSKIKITDITDLPPFPKNLSIYRILKDIPWNEKGARNLGATMSKTNWLLHTDFDHWFDNENLEKIINYPKKEKEIYRFKRVRDGVAIWKHRESHIIFKNNFFDVGGFDEDFSGFWGSGPYNLYFQLLKKKLDCKEKDLDIIINTLFAKKYPDCQTNLEKLRIKNESDYVRNKINSKNLSSEMVRFDWEKLL